MIGSIKRTLLVVHSADDPICRAEALPVAELARNPRIVTAITRHGGHMGFTAGISPLQHSWTDKLFVHYIRHLLKRDGTGPMATEPLAEPARPLAEGGAAADVAAGGRAAAAAGADGVPLFATNSRL